MVGCEMEREVGVIGCRDREREREGTVSGRLWGGDRRAGVGERGEKG